MSKIICERFDCVHEALGKCQLGTISIGKDFKCHCYHSHSNSDKNHIENDINTMNMVDFIKVDVDKEVDPEIFQKMKLEGKLLH